MSAPQEVPRADTETAGATIRVAGFRFTGNERIGEAELLAAIPELGSAIGRESNLAELHHLADRVSAYYRHQGYLVAKAYRWKEQEATPEKDRIDVTQSPESERLEQLFAGFSSSKLFVRNGGVRLDPEAVWR